MWSRRWSCWGRPSTPSREASEVGKRDLLTLSELSKRELLGLLDRAQELKQIMKLGGHHRPLEGRSLAMVFEKASTRTRVSFDVGMHQLGGRALMLKRDDLQIGRGESIPDTARVLSRYVDAILIRTFQHETVEMLAQHADVPVINGLTDKTHPCQVLADLLTCQEAFGAGVLGALRVAWIGDGNNMAHSWINAAQVLGFALTLACPAGYDPDPAIVEAACAAGADVRIFRDPAEATAGCHVVNTDVWASMGQEEEAQARRTAFADFQVDAALMARARSEAIFLHCLPAHRGEEVAAEVIDGPQSRVFDEAENRLHAQKALLVWLLRQQ
ncbi:MAG: ornithine carbamoyltransferase [Myxococcales bacterium]|nr:ornithine carbamoyltransferase [Myxococcales bacterium]